MPAVKNELFYITSGDINLLSNHNPISSKSLYTVFANTYVIKAPIHFRGCM